MTADLTDWAEAGLDYTVDDGVAWLRMNRPEKRNAMDRPLRTALLGAIHEATEDPYVRVAVITGEGTVFSAGADLRQDGGAHEVPPERRYAGGHGSRHDGILYGWYRLAESIWRSETPFIAAVNGPAIGGGCQLALGCDIVLASETATFWEIFVRIGLPLEGGAAWLLTRSISLARAKEMALYGEPIPASKAEQWGLVNAVVPAAELEATARDWAHRLAHLTPPGAGPSGGGPARDLSVRVGTIKGQLNAAWEQTMWQTFREEVTHLGLPPTGPAADED